LVLSNVEGIFTANPCEDPSAKRLAGVGALEALKRVATAGKSASGRGGMASKIEAVALAAQCGSHVVVASGLLVTGQNPASAAGVAQKMVELLKVSPNSP
jgi:glutamate 5-kinase